MWLGDWSRNVLWEEAHLKSTMKVVFGRMLLRCCFLSPMTLARKATFVSTISGWISQLIRFCYSQPGTKALQLSGTRAHEVRAYASSLVAKGTSAIDDILMAGNWRSHNTFTNHYLEISLSRRVIS